MDNTSDIKNDIENAQARKILAHARKVEAEANRLELEATEIKQRIDQKWYKGRFFVEAIVGGIVAAGLLSGWFIQYFKPILSHEQELVKIEIRRLEQENKLETATNKEKAILLAKQNSEIRNQLSQLTNKNNDLKGAQGEAVELAKSLKQQLEETKASYNILSQKSELTEAERQEYEELYGQAKNQLTAVQNDISKLESAKKETEKRTEDIILQKIIGSWDAYYNGEKNSDPNQIFLDEKGNINIHRTDRDSGKVEESMNDVKLNGDKLTYSSRDSDGESYLLDLKVVNSDLIKGVSISDKRGKASYEYRRVN